MTICHGISASHTRPASRWRARGSACTTIRKKSGIFELAERLINLDHQFQIWRFHHLKAVERIIGHKRGTGGTSGVPYLAKALELRFFPELWQVRTSM
jgi:tryptophan 2,3-dioxygenase